MFDSVLVATDGSEDAGVAVTHGIELARRLDVPLHGVAVVETRTAYDSDIVDRSVAEAALRSRAQSALESLERAATEAGVPVVTSLRTGVPHEEIIGYVREYDVSAIVVGARGRSSFRRALLGSTTDALVRLATVPVMVVGTDDSDDGAGGDTVSDHG